MSASREVSARYVDGRQVSHHGIIPSVSPFTHVRVSAPIEDAPLTMNTMPRHQPVSPLRPARPLYINEKEGKREGGHLPDSVCLLSHYVFLRFIQLSCPPPPHVMIVLGHVRVREYGAARRCCLFCCETCLYGRCFSLVARLLEQGEHILLVCLDTRLVEGVDTKQLS